MAIGSYVYSLYIRERIIMSENKAQKGVVCVEKKLSKEKLELLNLIIKLIMNEFKFSGISLECYKDHQQPPDRPQ